MANCQLQVACQDVVGLTLDLGVNGLPAVRNSPPPGPLIQPENTQDNQASEVT